MKILIAGGAGYIGSHVVLELLEQGHQVTVFDNLSTGHRKNISLSSKFIHGDILDEPMLHAAFDSSSFDAVFHFAALKSAGDSMINPGSFAKQNITGSINVLNAMVSHGVKNIIFSSTAAVYGYPGYNPIDENHPTIPINFYGFTKLEIERLLQWYSQLKDIRFAALRYFNAAGYDPKGRIAEPERNCANLLPIVLETAAGIREKVQVFGNDYETSDGTGVRDYIHVTDLAAAHIKAMNYLTENKADITINLGTGIGYTVMDVIHSAEKVTGKTIPYHVAERRPGDPDELIALSSGAYQILDWAPGYSDLETILQTMWALYRTPGQT